LAASGAITSALRLVTKAAFENSRDGLRKGASMLRLLLIKSHLHLFTSSDIFTYYLGYNLCSALLLNIMLLWAAMCPAICFRVSQAANCEVLSFKGSFRGISDSSCWSCRWWRGK